MIGKRLKTSIILGFYCTSPHSKFNYNVLSDVLVNVQCFFNNRKNLQCLNLFSSLVNWIEMLRNCDLVTFFLGNGPAILFFAKKYNYFLELKNFEIRKTYKLFWIQKNFEPNLIRFFSKNSYSICASKSSKIWGTGWTQHSTDDREMMGQSHWRSGDRSGT